ncbi:tetraspanin-8-like [Silene latifolia]|uniref:tetraspanin-8-like n=1 Tax=Silene latifolia TaxID=37657 RepID=UPI003D783519
MTIGTILWLRVLIQGHVKLDVGQEYRFKEFASWFKDVVFGTADWPEIRQCIMDRDLCLMDDNALDNLSVLVVIMGACCQLPPWCIYDPNNATIPDCHIWSTEKDKMCYYCDVCIGGFLAQVTELWRRLFPGFVALLFIVIAVFSIGFRAFRQHKADHYSKVCYTTKP